MNRLNDAETGMLCSMPFFMLSNVSFEKILSSVVVTELVILPVYCIEIFSYHRSLPMRSLRLKG